MLTQAVNQTRKLAISATSIAVLAAVLFGSFSLILPPNRWNTWWLPALIAAVGTVALLLAWPFREPSREWVLDGMAAALGLASAILGIGITLLIAYGTGLHVVEHQGSSQSLMFQMTHPAALWTVLGFAVIPFVPGVTGLWIARKRQTGRASLNAMAARFSMLGIALSILIAAVVGIAAFYRWMTWGI